MSSSSKVFTKIFLLYLLCYGFQESLPDAHAETIRLKSGKIIQGEIIGQSEEDIKVKTEETTYSIPLKYLESSSLSVVKTKLQEKGLNEDPSGSEPNAKIPGYLLLADHKEKEDFKNQIGSLIRAKEFDELEEIAQQLRLKKERFSSGSWKLEYFYEGLEASFEKQGLTQLKKYADILTQWGSLYPNSVTQKTALVEAYADLAWKYRGGGYSDTVAEDSGANFRNYLDKAQAVVEQAEKLIEKDPHFYTTAMIVGLGQGFPKSKMYELLEKGIQIEPLYYKNYRQMAVFLLPRWYGEEGEVEEFALWAARKTKDIAGQEMYARLADAIRKYVGVRSFDTHSFSWPTVKEAYQEILKKYPYSFHDLNAFAWFACQANDQETAAILFEQMGSLWDEISKEIWEDQSTLNQWREWAAKRNEYPGRKGMHVAAQNGDLVTLAGLIQAGEDINAVDPDGNTPLHMAIQNHETLAALLLIKAGANVRLKNHHGSEPIHNAASSGMIEIVRLLLEKGVPAEATDKFQKTALHLAASNGYEDICEILLQRNPDLIYRVDDGKSSALHIAAEEGQIGVVKLLLSRGDNVNAQNSYNDTPLHLAAKNGHTEVVRLLLEHQANPNLLNNGGASPLYVAQYTRHDDVVNVLKGKTQVASQVVKEEDRNKAHEYNQQGIQYFQEKNYVKAKESYQQALAKNPYDGSIYYNLSLMASDVDRNYSLALELVQKAMALDPSHAYSYYQAGRVAQALDKMEEAKKYYKKYIEMDPQSQYAVDLKRKFF